MKKENKACINFWTTQYLYVKLLVKIIMIMIKYYRIALAMINFIIKLLIVILYENHRSKTNNVQF